jgi:hypothetical protein
MVAKQIRRPGFRRSDMICFVIIGSLLASVVSIFVMNGQLCGITKRLALTEAAEAAREIESIIQARRFVVEQLTLKAGLKKMFRRGGLHEPGISIRRYFPDLIALAVLDSHGEPKAIAGNKLQARASLGSKDSVESLKRAAISLGERDWTFVDEPNLGSYQIVSKLIDGHGMLWFITARFSRAPFEKIAGQFQEKHSGNVGVIQRNGAKLPYRISWSAAAGESGKKPHVELSSGWWSKLVTVEIPLKVPGTFVIISGTRKAPIQILTPLILSGLVLVLSFLAGLILSQSRTNSATRTIGIHMPEPAVAYSAGEALSPDDSCYDGYLDYDDNYWAESLEDGRRAAQVVMDQYLYKTNGADSHGI